MLKQRRMASEIMKCGAGRVWIDPAKTEEVDGAITRADVRKLITSNVIKKLPEDGQSRVRAREIMLKKKKGQRKGQGSRKGAKKARTPKKEEWVKKIRALRARLFSFREKGKIGPESYRDLYRKSKGGFFRSTRHMVMYMKDRRMFNGDADAEKKD